MKMAMKKFAENYYEESSELQPYQLEMLEKLGDLHEDSRFMVVSTRRVTAVNSFINTKNPFFNLNKEE